jgi:hypothetical protein
MVVEFVATDGPQTIVRPQVDQQARTLRRGLRRIDRPAIADRAARSNDSAKHGAIPPPVAVLVNQVVLDHEFPQCGWSGHTLAAPHLIKLQALGKYPTPPIATMRALGVLNDKRAPHAEMAI